jgi:hypothetical protein
MIRRTLAIALFAALISGCANSDWMIRKPPVESTIGNDPNKAPAGKVIPPPGMGVDLGALLPDQYKMLEESRVCSRSLCWPPCGAHPSVHVLL